MTDETRTRRSLTRMKRLYSLAQEEFDAMESLAHARSYLAVQGDDTMEARMVLNTAFSMVAEGITPYHFEIRGSRR